MVEQKNYDTCICAMLLAKGSLTQPQVITTLIISVVAFSHKVFNTLTDNYLHFSLFQYISFVEDINLDKSKFCCIVLVTGSYTAHGKQFITKLWICEIYFVKQLTEP